jgi:uncharacterized metal-binding protein YceD (DUF177 family)
MKTLAPPLEHVFDLGDLSHAGSEITVKAKGDELAQLAKWAGVDAVRNFQAIVGLHRISQTQFGYEADLEADVVQSCVVTLEPVEARIARHISRELHLALRRPVEQGELTLAAGDDDVPETIASPDYDLAGPLLEEFVLAIDPYPRKEGVAFAPPSDPGEARESPFAVLKALKDQG